MPSSSLGDSIMLRLTLAAAMAVALAGCAEGPKLKPQPGGPEFACYRTIYNNSGCPWTFNIDRDYSQYGNVYFGDGSRSNCTELNGPCTVPANTSIGLKYTTTTSTSMGRFVISDQTGAAKKFRYDTDVMGQCPPIQHSGNTGAVAMNDPADGDMNAWGACTWADGANRPRR